MISLTRINNQIFTLNAEMIECIEETPDTVVTLLNGKTIMVKEKMAEVIKLVIRYKRLSCRPIKRLKKRC